MLQNAAIDIGRNKVPIALESLFSDFGSNRGVVMKVSKSNEKLGSRIEGGGR